MADAAPTEQTPLQRFAAEQAVLLAQQLEEVLRQAPPGQALRLSEAVALGQGRLLLQRLLEAGLQQQIDQGQQKGLPLGPVHADKNAATKATTTARS